MASVAIIGGGISGLSAAHALHEAGVPFALFEAADHIGGKLRSERTQGFLIEHGPNSLQSSAPGIDQLIREIGLEADRLFANSGAKKRFIVKQGMPQALPLSPPALLGGSFFSIRTKLALLKSLFASSRANGAEENVSHFIERRFGKEVLEYAVDPFVTGIFAGDPAKLSLHHAFPALSTLEEKHGSILRGVIAERKNKPTPEKQTARRVFSFSDGIQTLPDTLARSFQHQIHTSKKLSGMHRQGNRWALWFEPEMAPAPQLFDTVLLTLPLPALKKVSVDLGLDLAPLWNVYYPPVTVLALGFHRDDIDHPLDGFGMLVPGVEKDTRILGTIFSSSIFPNRAPKDHVLLTTLVGGARKADLCKLPADVLQDIVLDDLHALLGVHNHPVFARHIPWPYAIPQYNLGYGRVQTLLDDLASNQAGLHFAGNYRSGISVGDAVNSGLEGAKEILDGM